MCNNYIFVKAIVGIGLILLEDLEKMEQKCVMGQLLDLGSGVVFNTFFLGHVVYLFNDPMWFFVSPSSSLWVLQIVSCLFNILVFHHSALSSHSLLLYFFFPN